MRTRTFLIGVILTTSLFVVGLGSTAAVVSTPEPTDIAAPFTFIELDPQEVAWRAENGKPLVLPTMWSDATITSFERASNGVQLYHADEAGNLVDDGVFLPAVWKITTADGTISGVLLADGLQVRATLSMPQGRSTIEPGFKGTPSGALETLHRMYADEPTRAVVGEWEAHEILPTPPTPPGDIKISAVTRTMVAYVDNEFVGVWGGTTWPNHVSYLTTWLNTYMDDVQLTYSPDTMVQSDPGTSTNSAWSTGFNWLKTQNDLGMHTKVLWSHVDYDGCTVGQAAMPGKYAMLQTTDDACHAWNIVDTDFERAYFMAHELGHNNNGGHDPECSGCAWTSTVCCPHTHREILYQGGNYHLHECWGTTNANRMTAYLNTNFVGTACG